MYDVLMVRPVYCGQLWTLTTLYTLHDLIERGCH